MRKTLLLPVLIAAALAVPAPCLAAEGGAKAEKADGGEKDKKGDKKEDKKAAVHKITQSESYLMVDPLYTSIFDGNRPMGLLMLGIGIDVPNPDLREKVQRDMPRLRDGYVRALVVFSTTNVRSWRQPDVVAIADRLQAVTDRILNQKGAKVLLAQVAIQLNK